MDLPDGNDLVQYGHLKLESDLSIKIHTDKRSKPTSVFIFEKGVIMANPTKYDDYSGNGLFKFRVALNLANFQVKLLPDKSTSKCQLLVASGNEQYTLFMKSEVDHRIWKAIVDQAK